MAVGGVGTQAALSVGTLVGLLLILGGVIIYKRRKWRRQKKIREAQGNDLELNSPRTGLSRAVHRPLDIDPETNDPDLPTYQRQNPQDKAEQLSKVREEIKRLESLPLNHPNPSSQDNTARFETAGILEDLKKEAAVLEAQLAAEGGNQNGTDTPHMPQIPPPTYPPPPGQNRVD